MKIVLFLALKSKTTTASKSFKLLKSTKKASIFKSRRNESKSKLIILFQLYTQEKKTKILQTQFLVFDTPDSVAICFG